MHSLTHADAIRMLAAYGPLLGSATCDRLTDHLTTLLGVECPAAIDAHSLRDALDALVVLRRTPDGLSVGGDGCITLTWRAGERHLDMRFEAKEGAHSTATALACGTPADEADTPHPHDSPSWLVAVHSGAAEGVDDGAANFADAPSRAGRLDEIEAAIRPLCATVERLDDACGFRIEADENAVRDIFSFDGIANIVRSEPRLPAPQSPPAAARAAMRPAAGSPPGQIRVIVQDFDGAVSASFALTRGEWAAGEGDDLGAQVQESVAAAMDRRPPPEPLVDEANP